MLKIKDNVDLKELEKFGFKFLYSETTGEIKDIFKVKQEGLTKYSLHFLKNKHKKKIIKVEFNYRENCWYIDETILWCYSRYNSYDFDFDTLYDLIKANLVEKV